jgi:hypothetical protein
MPEPQIDDHKVHRGFTQREREAFSMSQARATLDKVITDLHDLRQMATTSQDNQICQLVRRLAKVVREVLDRLDALESAGKG